MRPGISVAVVALLCSPALVGCSVSAGTPTVAETELETQISDQLEIEVGTKPDEIDCPGGLRGRVGATQECVLTHGGDQLGVHVEVTEVEDTNVKFSIEVEDPAE